MVRVIFKNILKEFAPGKQEVLDVEHRKNMTVTDLLSTLEMDHGQVGVVIVDGVLVKNRDFELVDGSVVELYPLFAGG